MPATKKLKFKLPDPRSFATVGILRWEISRVRKQAGHGLVFTRKHRGSTHLAPVPRRRKRNEPACVRYVVETIATVKKVPLEKVARKTAETVQELFKMKAAVSEESSS